MTNETYDDLATAIAAASALGDKGTLESLIQMATSYAYRLRCDGRFFELARRARSFA